MSKRETPKKSHWRLWLVGLVLVLLFIAFSWISGIRIGFNGLVGFGTGHNGNGNSQPEANKTTEPLQQQPPSPLLFRPEHFQNLSGLKAMAIKIRDAQEPVSAYIQTKLTPTTKLNLLQYDGKSYPPENLEKGLLNDLNRLLLDTKFYDQQRFAHVTLSDESRRLLQESPQGDQLARLNRLLIEEAYAQEISLLYVFHFRNDRIFHREMQITWERFVEILNYARRQKTEMRQEVDIKLVFDAATTTNGFELKVQQLLQSLNLNFARELLEKTHY